MYAYLAVFDFVMEIKDTMFQITITIFHTTLSPKKEYCYLKFLSPSVFVMQTFELLIGSRSLL